MAGFRETIHLLIDVDGSGATTSVGKLRTEIANTDGAFNKMKVAGGGAFDLLKQHAATAGIAIATGVAVMAGKAIKDFQDTALGAGQLRDALGLTADEASRLQEVAGDLGIPVSALETSLGKMNKTAGNTPEVFKAAGAEIQRNADGTMNVNDTFLNVIDTLHKMPDAGNRAAAGAKIFGKGWQDVAQLVEMGADGVTDALASVENAKVIDDKEIKRAREFRDTLDSLRGVGESLSIAVGGELVDAFNTWSTAVGNVQAAFDDLTPDVLEGTIGDVLPDLLKATNLIGLYTEGLGLLNAALGGAGDEITASFGPALGSSEVAARLATDAASAFEGRLASTTGTVEEAGEAIDETANATERLKRQAEDLDRAWSDLKGEVSDDQAWIDVQDSFADIHTSAQEAFDAASTGAADAAQKARDHASAVNATKDRIIDFGREVLNLPDSHVSDIIARLDEGQVAEVEERLRILARNRNMQISITTSGGDLINSLPGSGGRRASGGPVEANKAYVVGEEGEELFVPGTNGRIIPNGGSGTPAAASAAGPVNFYVTVNAGMGANGSAVARDFKNALAAAARTEGRDSLRRILGL